MSDGFFKKEGKWFLNELDTRALLRQSQVVSYEAGLKRTELRKLEKKANKQGDPVLQRRVELLRAEIERLAEHSKALSDEHKRRRDAEDEANRAKRRR